MARVMLQGVTKRFGDTIAVNNVDLQVADGEFMVLLGPSGCGKSTTMRLIAGLEDPDEGEIYIGNRLVNEIEPSKRNIAMVFQSYALYPHMTVYKNIAFPLKMRGVPKDEIDRKVKEAADMLNIIHLLKRMPRQLSGGEMQRVALARAIVREPMVFLLDEPLSNLDAKLRVKMRFELRKLLHDELKVTTVYVTHDQVEALTMADRIAVMKKGRVLQVDVADGLFNRPRDIFVAGFIGSPPMNFIEGVVNEHDGALVIDAKGLELPMPTHFQEALKSYLNSEITVGVRPQDIKVFQGKGARGILGYVLGVERLGTESYLHIISGDCTIVIRVDPESKFKEGERIWWVPRETRLHFFDTKTGAVIAKT